MFRRKCGIKRLKLFYVLILIFGILFLPLGLITDSNFCWADASVPVVLNENGNLDEADSNGKDHFITTAMAANIADTHAKGIWDGEMARGKPFLLHKADGTPFAYVFPYALNTSRFPSYDKIFKAVRVARGLHSINDKQFFMELEKQIGSFGSVEIAISRSHFPVLVVRHSLHPYFLYSEHAAEIAKHRLNSQIVKLVNVEFNGPHELYFNFSSSKGEIKLHAYLLKTKEDLKPMTMRDKPAEEETVQENEIVNLKKIKAWEEIDNQTVINQTHSVKWIKHWTILPVVQWTHWCVPTAWTMVAGYWDHYDPRQGTWPNWGGIIDYWFDHPAICQNNNVTNVPNFMDEMITHQGNCSWAPGGFLGALNTNHGYNFSMKDTKGTAKNDWGWPEIVSEIDRDRPVVWGVGPVRAHAMAALGYRISGSQKFVIVYNTWGSTAKQQLAEYNYLEWSGSPNTQTGVGRLWPGGGNKGNHAVLIFPRGGETVEGSTKITWFVWGSEIKWTIVSFSSDGGTSWKNVHQQWLLPTKPGWNSYTAVLKQNTSKGRIRIRCYSSSFKYIAGDGSPKKFYVQAKPDLIPISACNRDSLGRLIIRVKNQGTKAAGASVTRVKFFPGGVFDLNFPITAAGATAEVPLPVPGKCWNPDCDYQIKVDVNKQVNEANEANNSASGACFS